VDEVAVDIEAEAVDEVAVDIEAEAMDEDIEVDIGVDIGVDADTEGIEEVIEDIVTDLIADIEITTPDGIIHIPTTTLFPTITFGGTTGLDTLTIIQMGTCGIMDIPTSLITATSADTPIEISVTTS